MIIVAVTATASADPRIQIGERRFVGGRGVTAVAVRNEQRALSVERCGARGPSAASDYPVKVWDVAP